MGYHQLGAGTWGEFHTSGAYAEKIQDWCNFIFFIVPTLKNPRQYRRNCISGCRLKGCVGDYTIMYGVSYLAKAFIQIVSKNSFRGN